MTELPKVTKHHQDDWNHIEYGIFCTEKDRLTQIKHIRDEEEKDLVAVWEIIELVGEPTALVKLSKLQKRISNRQKQLDKELGERK